MRFPDCYQEWGGKTVDRIAAKRTRRSRRAARRRRRLRFITGAAVLLLGAAALLFLYPRLHSRWAAGFGAEPNAAAATHAVGGLRVVATEPALPSGPRLPYSVIPGGVHSEKQLARVLARDPVVARHYANFNLSKLHFVRLGRGRTAYVSYRLGGEIFWTRKKIPLFAGETLLTDGSHLARARCGNRVSEVPRQPTSPWQPPDLTMVVPLAHLTPIEPQLPPLTTPSVDVLPLGPPVVDSGVLPIFPIILLPPGGGTGSPPLPPSPEAPLPTPEPTTLLLFSSGLTILGLKYLWNMRSR